MVSMGNVGKLHADGTDDPACVTNTLSISDLSPETDPGCMMMVLPRVYIPMSYLTACNFGGHAYHVGIPASTFDETVIGKDKRELAVLYPQARAHNGDQRLPLFMLPGNTETFKTSIEYHIPE